MRLIYDDDGRIRYSVAYALGDLARKGDLGVIGALQTLLDDTNEDVRNAANVAIHKLQAE
jgi:HEAT repeat protein